MNCQKVCVEREIGWHGRDCGVHFIEIVCLTQFDTVGWCEYLSNSTLFCFKVVAGVVMLLKEPRWCSDQRELGWPKVGSLTGRQTKKGVSCRA